MVLPFLQAEIEKRGLPPILNHPIPTAAAWENRRKEIVEILACEEYGHIPVGGGVECEIISQEKEDYAGKAMSKYIRINAEVPGGVYSFPVNIVIPKSEKSVPVFVHINFRPDSPDKYMPVEEIIDRGFAVASFCYNDVTPDKHDRFTGGVAAYFDRGYYDCGKISMWAWAASRVLDYLLTLPQINPNLTAVIGHSRLGKTALWCGANDTRFQYIFSNNSGCSGGAVTRQKTGEHVNVITKNFPHWFCENYYKYADSEDTMPFDQHFLVAAAAPRRVMLGTAIEDDWADPYSEYLAAYAASAAYEALDLRGLCGEDRVPIPGDTYLTGHIGYHLRSGGHFLSRYDWNRYMDFVVL